MAVPKEPVRLAQKPQLPDSAVKDGFKINLKCTECGNTFQKDCTAPDEVVTCPICEAQYKVVATTDGKLRLEDFVIDEEDYDEL